MTRQPLTFSPSYLAVARGIRGLHRLAVDGQDDSPEADAIRDAIDGPWEALSETERKRVSGLSEDLYAISEPASEAEAMNPQAQAKLAEADGAREHGEWDRALELLRRWSKHVSPSVLSYLRGLVWLEGGDPEAAALFFGHATDLEPQNGSYLAFYLHALDLVDPTEAYKRSVEILQDSDNYSPCVVWRAADIEFKAIRLTPEAKSASGFQRLIPILERTLTRIEEDEDGPDRSTFGATCALLGFCHELLGNLQAAIECYSRGLQLNPNNDGLLVARGILLYGSSPRAITDFELAVENRTPLILPYYCLAHHYLISRRFSECLAVYERAARMPAPDSVLSELAEWAAICQAESGFSAEAVRSSFDSSIRLDPSNERARRNLAVFEAALHPPVARAWEMPHEAVIRASALSAHRYVLAA
jgi:tetratricopeptide (TPR) repeat protein